MSHELFHVSGKAVLFNENRDKIVLLHHEYGFSIPGGHLEKDESIKDALLREIKEELDVDYDGELRLADAHKYYPRQTETGKVDLYFVGTLAESAPISTENSGDDITDWEWAPVNKILNGDYEDWLKNLLEEILK